MVTIQEWLLCGRNGNASGSAILGPERAYMIRLRIMWSLLVTAVLFAGVQHANAEFIPAGLNPGDTYQLVFITNTNITAISSNIADYNAFAQAQAAASGAITQNYGIGWTAIASTASVNARDNAVVSAPVYLLDGTLIATGFDDIWDGFIQSPISIDQFGVFQSGLVWTGSEANGYATVNQVGPLGAASGVATVGLSTAASPWWIARFDYQPIDGGFAVYVLSDVLTVPTAFATPLPSALALLLSGVPAGFGLLYRRRKQKAAEQA